MTTLDEVRDPLRPRVSDWWRRLGVRWFALHGDRLGGGDDPVVIGGPARWRGRSFIVAGLERPASPGLSHAITPAGFRKVERLVGLSHRLAVPFVSFVDGVAADPSLAASDAGQAQALSSLTQRLVHAAVPTIGVVVGEASSGGAMALLSCDRLLMLRSTVFEVIAPEACANILFKRIEAADEALQVTQPFAELLYAQGRIEQLVGDSGLGTALQRALRVKKALTPTQRLKLWTKRTALGPSSRSEIAPRPEKRR